MSVSDPVLSGAEALLLAVVALLARAGRAWRAATTSTSPAFRRGGRAPTDITESPFTNDHAFQMFDLSGAIESRSRPSIRWRAANELGERCRSIEPTAWRVALAEFANATLKALPVSLGLS